MYLGPSVKKFKKIVSQRNMVVLGELSSANVPMSITFFRFRHNHTETMSISES